MQVNYRNMTYAATLVAVLCSCAIWQLRQDARGSEPQAQAAQPTWEYHAEAAGLEVSGDVVGQPSDISCTSNPQSPHFLLAYVVPANMTERADGPGQLRSLAWSASKLLDHSARVKSSGSRGSRLRVLCDAQGEAVVHTLRVAQTSPVAISQLGSEVKQQLGLPAWPQGVNIVMLVEGAGTSGSAGIAQTWAASAGSSIKDASNRSNRGGLVAAVFRFDNQVPIYPATLLHEIMHTLGAVSADSAAPAPGYTTGSHCVNGQDVMCYDDGTPQGDQYRDTVCAQLEIDCIGDAYFAPTPAPGSYLSSHWNIATDAPDWLDYGITEQPAPLSLPQPNSLRLLTRTSSSVKVRWNAPADPERWHVWVRTTPGVMRRIAVIDGTRRVFEVRGLRASARQQVYVYPALASGSVDMSQARPLATRTFAVQRPIGPTLRVVKIAKRSAIVRWGRVNARTKVRRYEILVRDVPSKRWRLAARRGAKSHVAVVKGLRPGRLSLIAIRVVDDANNRSRSYYLRVRA